jgi:hypothetical protein
MKLFGDQLTDMRNKMSRASNQSNLLSKLVYTYSFIYCWFKLNTRNKYDIDSTTKKN